MFNEIEYMQFAYKLLYEIETLLKQNVDSILTKNYGTHWKHILKERKNFENTLYHEVVSCYGKYPPLTSTFTDSERNFLYFITEIRNKIAHMKILTNEEYNNLRKCNELVKPKLSPPL